MNNDIVLWDLLEYSVWQQLQRDGVLLDEPDWAYPDEPWYPNFEWFRQQIALRLPATGSHRPFRAALTKFDLRFYRFHMPPGRHVRLGLRIPREQVILFDDCAWFCGMLVNRYIARSEEEQAEKRRWEAELKRIRPELEGAEDFQLSPQELPERLASQLTASWQRVFAIEGVEEECIWGAFATLTLDQVFSVTEFTAIKTK